MINKKFDIIILGAGAAGLMAALTAAQRNKSVLILEKSNKAGKKILMSGGGRSNFTNLYVEAENFLSNNPHFCKSALSRYTPDDFINLVKKHGIDFEEAKEIFNDKNSLQIEVAKINGEGRIAIIGKINKKMWAAIYTIRSEKCRLISCRRARKKEVSLYEKNHY